MNKIYTGFSLSNYIRNRTTRIYDVECVIDDLKRHIYTMFGERVKMISWGSEIPLLTFEQNDKVLIDYVSGQLNTIFKSDPRITIKNIELYALPDDNALVCISTLLFNEFGIIEDLSIQIKGL
mgnify:FL=1